MPAASGAGWAFKEGGGGEGEGGVGVVLTFAREMAISPSKADVIGLARADRCW